MGYEWSGVFIPSLEGWQGLTQKKDKKGWVKMMSNCYDDYLFTIQKRRIVLPNVQECDATTDEQRTIAGNKKKQ
jgi:hypothetical protein